MSSKSYPTTADEYRKQVSLEDRITARETQQAKERFRGKIPTLIFRRPGSESVDLLDKNKFFIAPDNTMQVLTMAAIRKRIKLQPEIALFTFVVQFENGAAAPSVEQIAPAHETMARIYEQFKSDDGYLYIVYAGETALGA
jgi:GABA(A) receptor-associated protein